jgi:hypothetical protein
VCVAVQLWPDFANFTPLSAPCLGVVACRDKSADGSNALLSCHIRWQLASQVHVVSCDGSSYMLTIAGGQYSVVCNCKHRCYTSCCITAPILFMLTVLGACGHGRRARRRGITATI